MVRLMERKRYRSLTYDDDLTFSNMPHALSQNDKKSGLNIQA